MAAPNGIVWGSIVGDYGRIGIYTSLSNTDTTSTLNVEVWFWSKYSVSDANNHLYYDNLASSGSATTDKGSVSVSTTVATGDGWSTSNQVKIASYKTDPYTRGTSAVKRYLYVKLMGIDRVSGVMYASTTATIPALPTYTINYNANGGSGAPSSQTKKYKVDITLSSTKPTRTGYTFQGWALTETDADDGTWYYQPGGTCARNENLTLYAVWKANTYTVKYNANGGTGAPGNQTKTHGVALTLSSTKPTRTNYNFKGWATSASATTATYAAGGSYKTNAAVTLYAVWELGYVKPRLFNLSANRCDANGTLADEGTCALIAFEWETDRDVSAITVAWESAVAGSGSASISASGTGGTVSQVVGDSTLSEEVSYTVTVTVTDSLDSNDAVTTLNGSKFTFDAKAGGDGVSFGKPAELGKAESLGGSGVADFAFDAKFNEPVYGKALGMDRLPAIPANADFNDYIDPGCYAVQRNDTSTTIANIPVEKAGRLEVWSATGEGVRSEQWSYIRQRFIPYNSANAVWEREITRGEDNVWNYYNWWRSSLTPSVSNKVYHEQKVLWSGAYYMTASHSAPLSEKISDQPNGVVLVFSLYSPDNGAYDSHWTSFFVPKYVPAQHSGASSEFLLVGMTYQLVRKILHLYDDRIQGNEINNASGTTTAGTVYANNSYVLRYVIGV